MDNYEAMKPWEHGKIVEIHPDIKAISVYSVVYENKDFYVCRVSGSTEIITIRKNSYQNYVFESYEKYMSWRRNNSLDSLNNRRFFVYIPKDGKISFADNFPVRDSLDEALAKAERAYDEEEKSFKRLQTSLEYYANRIEDTKETLRLLITVLLILIWKPITVLVFLERSPLLIMVNHLLMVLLIEVGQISLISLQNNLLFPVILLIMKSMLKNGGVKTRSFSLKIKLIPRNMTLIMRRLSRQKLVVSILSCIKGD